MLVLAYDGSPVAKRALEHAATLVGRGGELAVVNVIPVQSVSSRLETVAPTRAVGRRASCARRELRSAVEASSLG